MTADLSSDLGPIKAALYVDFDNIFIGLRNIDPAAAHAFATNPGRWLGWIERGMPREGSAAAEARSALIRRCYLNPGSFARYRDNFTNAAFSVVDCPSLTYSGKNSADIHMVMDILDTLSRFTHFSEFIILSGDSDFTPVLLRLRAYDRRTAILTTAKAAPAYASASDLVLSADLFIREGLGVRATERHTAAPPVVVKAAPPITVLVKAGAAPPAAASAVGAEAAEAKKKILDFVKQYLDKSPNPVDLALLASRTTDALRQVINGTNWAGVGSFKRLLTANPELGWKIESTPDRRYTYLLDPARHALAVAPPEVSDAADGVDDSPPQPEADDTDGSDALMDDLARRVNKAAGAPVLAAPEYALVFRLIERELRKDDFRPGYAAVVVRDACRERGVTSVSRAGLLNIMRIVDGPNVSSMSDHRQDTADELARHFRRRVGELCAEKELKLTAEEEALLDEWLLGGEVEADSNGIHKGAEEMAAPGEADEEPDAAVSPAAEESDPEPV